MPCLWCVSLYVYCCCLYFGIHLLCGSHVSAGCGPGPYKLKYHMLTVVVSQLC